jgi:hypothetical protein
MSFTRIHEKPFVKCFTSVCPNDTVTVNSAYCDMCTSEYDQQARDRMGYHCRGCDDPFGSYMELLAHQGWTSPFACPGQGLTRAPRVPREQI